MLISTRQGRGNRALGHVMLGTKINKNRPNIHQKTALKSTLQFGSILEPTWLHFGRILGAKMGPSWLQMAPKIDPENDTKNDHLLDRLKIDFWSILGPNLAPKKGNHYSLFGLFFALGALLGPRCPKDPSKRPLGTPKTPPRGLLGAIFNDFGFQLGSFYSQLERFSTAILVDLTANQPDKQPTNQPTIQPTRQPNNQTSLHP